jgi:hypothetical protein
LQYAHPIGISKNLVRLLVVYITDVVEGNEKFERVFGIGFSYASFDFLLNLVLALLPVAKIMSVCADFEAWAGSDLVKPRSLFLYAHNTDLFCFISILDMI